MVVALDQRKEQTTLVPAHETSVSVIIPYSKPDKVGNAIESVLAQDYPADLLEVILVGKGSSTLQERWPQIRAIDVGPIREPGRARNLGAAKASGEVLLFLDDDCEAQEGWIQENLAELKDPQVGAVSGMIEGKSKAFFARCVDFANFSLCQIQRRQERPICTASFAIRRDLFEHIGGFNTRLRIHEDIDICYRLEAQGLSAVYQPKVKVLHDHGRGSFRSMVQYLYSGGREGGLLVEEQYRDRSRFNRWITRFNHPAAYAVVVLPFATGATLRTVLANVREHPEVLWLSPFIFLGKLSCHWGIWRSLFSRHLSNKWQFSGKVQTARRLVEYSLFRGEFKNPRELTLFVTSRCNARCQHCFYWRNLNRRNDLSLWQIEALSHSLGKLDKVLISGGEPFLRADLPEVCELFFRNNNADVISIPTNGISTGLIVKQARRILERAGGRTVNISISLDGLKSRHDAIRGVAGAFDGAVRTYHGVHELEIEFKNLRTTVNSVITDKNCDDLFLLMDEIPSLMPDVNVPCFALLRGNPSDVRLGLPSTSKLRALYKYKVRKCPGNQPTLWRIADWATFCLSVDVLVRRRQSVPCEAGRICGVVEDNGDVKHCEMLPPIGNLREAAFHEIWNSEKSREERRRIVEGHCHCTHECYLFPSLLAHPIKGLPPLLRAVLQGA